MQTPAGSQELVIEAVLPDGVVLVAEFGLVDVLRLLQQRRVRKLQADVVKGSNTSKVGLKILFELMFRNC